MQVPSLGGEDPLEKGIATHSILLAWRIPWIEEPGGLQSTGSQRAGDDWGDSPARHAGTDLKQNVKGNDLRAQQLSCVQLCDLMDCSLPGSSVLGILQARTLEWVAISFSRGSSQFWNTTHITCGSCLAADSLSLSHLRSPPKTTQCILIHKYLCKEHHF